MNLLKWFMWLMVVAVSATVNSGCTIVVNNVGESGLRLPQPVVYESGRDELEHQTSGHLNDYVNGKYAPKDMRIQSRMLWLGNPASNLPRAPSYYTLSTQPGYIHGQGGGHVSVSVTVNTGGGPGPVRTSGGPGPVRR